jgi:hypothetical protein
MIPIKNNERLKRRINGDIIAAGAPINENNPLRLQKIIAAKLQKIILTILNFIFKN